MVLIKKFKGALISGILLGLLFAWDSGKGLEAINISGFALTEMLSIIPPIFILLGLLDVWISRETMIKLMGKESGAKGVLLAFFFGSATVGPLYGAFPVAAVFMKKGVKFSNIMIFIGAWSTTKIPMLLFEISSMGAPFALTRLLVNIPGIMIMAWIIDLITPDPEIEKLYERMERM